MRANNTSFYVLLGDESSMHAITPSLTLDKDTLALLGLLLDLERFRLKTEVHQLVFGA